MVTKTNRRHKVFLSYYHADDQYYKDRFEKMFGDVFIHKSVQMGDINTEISDEYCKRLIREDYISDSSVVIVLCGNNTYRRKHVDWEIYAGLTSRAGGCSGLLGIRLPTRSDYGKPVNYDTIPKRLADNVQSGYAKLYDWTEDSAVVKKWVRSAFESKARKQSLIQNSSRQFTDNLFPWWFSVGLGIGAVALVFPMIRRLINRD